MDNGQLVKSISEISKKEIPLLYYYPKEVERAISDGRLITVCENGKNIGFGFWHSYGNWIELSTMYIAPEFRGKGYLHKLIDAIRLKLQDKIPNLFLFTQAPQVVRVIENFGFGPASLSSLPFSVLAKLILHRLNLRRWLSYAKHIKNLPRVFETRLYVRRAS